MLSRLIAIFVIVPAAELYLLIRLGEAIGAAETFGIILLTGILGSYLDKSQGTTVWRSFQAKLASGSVPGKEIADGVIILISAALLITPGIITDVIGLLGLLPATRAFIRKYVYAKILPGLVTTGVGFAVRNRPFPNNGFNGRGDSGPGASPAPPGDIHIGGTARRRPTNPSGSPPSSSLDS